MSNLNLNESSIEEAIEKYLLLLNNKNEYVEQIRQLQADKKANELEIEEFKTKIKDFLNLNNGKYKTEKFTLDLKEIVPTVVLVDIDLVPKEYIKATYTINKTSIKNSILLGKKINGVKLVPTIALRIINN